MKKTIKILTAILFSAVATILVGQNNLVLADDDTPVVTLGTSLTDSQKDGTLKTLTAPLNGGNYQTITVTGSDLVRYLNPSGDNFTTSSGVWSSAMIQKTSSGSGINVKILDYNGRNNITTITANQYKNAALTAGITDANIYVTSAIPIDGSGALAGVYAAYAKNGNALNQKQVNAAQDEMNTLSGITQDNKNKKGYSDAQLNNAVAGAKSEMAKQGQNISDSQIRDIVNNQININHLGNTINNNQKNQIINLLIEIRDSGALKSSDFKGQASKLSSQIENSAKNIFNKFNTPENRSWLQQLWDSIVNFFSHMFGGVILE
ncbi:DUF1002 domain-containing protein [Lactobacillus kitasatonis]|uniref:DUF1002 domain-containing protein n=1 Tax=Lactobacillus kitasatonis TaxID=237446 RepID=UPI00388D66E8